MGCNHAEITQYWAGIKATLQQMYKKQRFIWTTYNNGQIAPDRGNSKTKVTGSWTAKDKSEKEMERNSQNTVINTH